MHALIKVCVIGCFFIIDQLQVSESIWDDESPFRRCDGMWVSILYCILFVTEKIQTQYRRKFYFDSIVFASIDFKSKCFFLIRTTIKKGWAFKASDPSRKV